MGQGARRVLAATVASLAIGSLVTACADFGDPTGAATASTRPESALQLGENIRTGSGNVVAVLDYEFPAQGTRRADRVAAARVQACAGVKASSNTGASPAFFRLELTDRRGVPATSPARRPPLRGVALKPGECADGWVSFALAPGDTVRYVTFRGSSVAKWEVPR